MKSLSDAIKESLVNEGLDVNTNLEKTYKFISGPQFKSWVSKFYGKDMSEDMLDEIYDDLVDALIHINSRAISAAENTEASNDNAFWKEYQDMWDADNEAMWEGAEDLDEQAVVMAGTLYQHAYKKATGKSIKFEIDM